MGMHRTLLWIKKHPIISAAIGAIPFVQAAWGLFSSEPLIPAAARFAQGMSLPSQFGVWINLGTMAISGTFLLLVAQQARERQVSLQAWKREAARTSQDIFQFLADRKRAEPSWVQGGGHEEWQRSSDEHLRHSFETMALFDQRFGARVLALHQTLRKNGLSDEDQEFRYRHPTNPLGIREVAQHLGEMAERL